MTGEYDAGYEHYIDGLHREIIDYQIEVEQVKGENAKLQEQIHWLKKGDILHVLTDQEYIDKCERERLMQVSIDALDKENTKLRELVRDMWRGCPVDERDCIACDFEQDGMCDLFDRMRELGVEV